jgi:hypothetical protein
LNFATLLFARQSIFSANKQWRTIPPLKEREASILYYLLRFNAHHRRPPPFLQYLQALLLLLRLAQHRLARLPLALVRQSLNLRHLRRRGEA